MNQFTKIGLSVLGTAAVAATAYKIYSIVDHNIDNNNHLKRKINKPEDAESHKLGRVYYPEADAATITSTDLIGNREGYSGAAEAIKAAQNVVNADAAAHKKTIVAGAAVLEIGERHYAFRTKQSLLGIEKQKGYDVAYMHMAKVGSEMSRGFGKYDTELSSLDDDYAEATFAASVNGIDALIDQQGGVAKE